jgi:formiminotetrahydrofolate cyclodeaminase
MSDGLKRKVPPLQVHLSTPFDSVENTQEYFGLLSETLEEVKQEIDRDITAAAEAKQSRRLEALRLVHFKLRKLEDNVKASSLLLNDLRSLRRLLLHERVTTEEVRSR